MSEKIGPKNGSGYRSDYENPTLLTPKSEVEMQQSFSESVITVLFGCATARLVFRRGTRGILRARLVALTGVITESVKIVTDFIGVSIGVVVVTISRTLRF